MQCFSPTVCDKGPLHAAEHSHGEKVQLASLSFCLLVVVLLPAHLGEPSEFFRVMPHVLSTAVLLQPTNHT